MGMAATKHLSVAALTSTPRLGCHISMLQNICAKPQYFTVRVLRELYKQNKKLRTHRKHRKPRVNKHCHKNTHTNAREVIFTYIYMRM